MNEEHKRVANLHVAASPSRKEAVKFISMLVERGHLELVPGAQLTTLPDEIAPFLTETPNDVGARSSSLMERLLDNDEVEEVFVDDESFTQIMAAW